MSIPNECPHAPTGSGLFCVNCYPQIEKLNTKTLRDEFAMAALAGISPRYFESTTEAIALLAYRFADSMLEARKIGREEK